MDEVQNPVILSVIHHRQNLLYPKYYYNKEKRNETMR
jgi:hypothetical protein